MSGIRLGSAFGFENKPGEGPTKTNGWLICPPNFFITITPIRSTNRMDAMGTKRFDYIAYGGHYVNWSATFTADYEMLEMFLGAFEHYEHASYGFSYVNPNNYKTRFLLLSEKYTQEEDPYVGSFNHVSDTGESYGVTVVKDGTKYKVTVASEGGVDTTLSTPVEIKKIYKHTFKKSDIKRVPTMCFRRLQLNHQVGGKHGDEILEVYGAVCTEWAISATAGASQIQVNMSGFAYKPFKKLVPFLDTTEYNAYNGEHVMYACLFDSWTAGTDTYISDVQSLRANIKNNATKVYSTCGPVMTNYQEGKSDYELTVNLYSKDATFRDRVFTGGQKAAEWMPNYDTVTIYENEYGMVVDPSTPGATAKGPYGYLKTPLCKNLYPMDQASIVSYDTCRDIEAGKDLGSTIQEADFKFSLMVDDVVFKQMSLERGDSSKLMDNLTSAECREMWLEVLSDVEDYETPADSRYNLNIKPDNMIWRKTGNKNEALRNN